MPYAAGPLLCVAVFKFPRWIATSRPATTAQITCDFFRNAFESVAVSVRIPSSAAHVQTEMRTEAHGKFGRKTSGVVSSLEDDDHAH